MRYRRHLQLFAFCALAALCMAPLVTSAAPQEHRESAQDPSIVRGAPLPFHEPRRESAEDPEVVRTAPIPSPTLPVQTTPQVNALAPAALAPAAQPSFGPNLVPNPSLETAGSNGLPASWHKGGYGTNARTLTYPVAGTAGSGSKAISLAVSSYTSGDAKWYSDDFPVTGGKQYAFSDAYQSSATSIVDIRFALSNGSFIYTDIATPGPSAGFTTATAQVTAPAGAVSATIFHLLNRNGSLTTDDYSFREIIPPPPSGGSNAVQNGDFETAGAGGLPANWSRGGYGTNARTLAYPVAGAAGNGAQVTISNYASGDAKWVFDRISIPPGTYVYSDSYKSTVPSILTAEFQRADGSLFYSDLKTLPASASFTAASATFVMPADAVAMRVFHLIKQNGTLTIDNVSVVSSAGGGGIFSTGAVTFRFDDGLLSQFNNAVPALDAAGLKATFYIITQEIADDGFTGFMSKAQVQSLAAKGYEIGAHTRTHPHLLSLTPDQQVAEISGSRQDLLGWNVGPILSFSYPYGEYDANVIQEVVNAGFTSAASTITGYVTPNSDPYQLEYQEPHNDTSLATMESWVDNAASTHTWLIITLHDVDQSGTLYAVTPSTFQSLVAYVKQKGIPVITVSQGRAALP